MEHFLRDAFCGVNLVGFTGASGCCSVTRPRGPVLSAPALIFCCDDDNLQCCCFLRWFKGHRITEKNEAMEHSPETTALQRSAGAKGNGPVNDEDG